VWHRVGQRIAALHLGGPAAYRSYLESHPEEWRLFDSFCRIPISRFLRDRETFERLAHDVLPAIAAAAVRRGEHHLRAWSAGCASGEEPYSLALLWCFELQTLLPTFALDVLATDVDERLLERARAARYRRSSLREVPAPWIDAGFSREGEWFLLRPEFQSMVEFQQADVRTELPDGPFDLILCRNLVCTYFDEPLRHRTLGRLLSILRPDGALVIGKDERLPHGLPGVETWDARLGIFRRTPNAGLLLPPMAARCN
jgi:chemotaxis protein methyltransferase CheR